MVFTPTGSMFRYYVIRWAPDPTRLKGRPAKAFAGTRKTAPHPGPLRAGGVAKVLHGRLPIAEASGSESPMDEEVFAFGSFRLSPAQRMLSEDENQCASAAARSIFWLP